MTHARFGRRTQVAILGGAFAVLLGAVYLEEAAAAGAALLQHVAGSYLVMFVDRMSMTFLCL